MAAKRRRAAVGSELQQTDAVNDQEEGGAVGGGPELPGDLPVVERRHTPCPWKGCGSIRSALVATEVMPSGEGRIERRRCLSCTRQFRVWDPRWRRKQAG
jgi:hypothetical protein